MNILKIPFLNNLLLNSNIKINLVEFKSTRRQYTKTYTSIYLYANSILVYKTPSIFKAQNYKIGLEGIKYIHFSKKHIIYTIVLNTYSSTIML